jgi:hypothetical protein
MPLRSEQQKHANGTVVYKEFLGHGWFQGEVVSFNGVYFRIRYADGDEEDCDEAELDEALEKAKLRPPKLGTTIQKEFLGRGWFQGRVTAHDGTYYKVYYDDGSIEEYDETEIEDLQTMEPPLYPVGTPLRISLDEYGVFNATVIAYDGSSYTVLYRHGDQKVYHEADLAKKVTRENGT